MNPFDLPIGNPNLPPGVTQSDIDGPEIPEPVRDDEPQADEETGDWEETKAAFEAYWQRCEAIIAKHRQRREMAKPALTRKSA